MNTQDPTPTDKSAPVDDPDAPEQQTLATAWAARATELQDAPNLVEFFTRQPEELKDEATKFLADVAKQVTEDHDAAWESSEEYREKRRRDYQMLTGFLPPRDGPIEGGANAHTPLYLERHLRLTSNIYAEFFSDRDTWFTVEPTGPDDYELAELLTLHGNWQLKNEITDFLRQQERGISEFFAVGSVFCHSYYDSRQGRNRHDILTCDDFVFPYVHTTVQVDMSDVPYKSKIVRKFRAELEDLRDSGEWAQLDTVLAKDPPAWDFVETKAREFGSKNEGIVAPERSKSSPYVFLEYHGYLRFPGDKRQRPVCAIVDKQTKTVVRLYIREKADWRDLARVESQTRDLGQYTQHVGMYQQAMGHENDLRMRLSAPDIAPEEAAHISQALGSEPMQMPTAPLWMDKHLQAGLPLEAIKPEPARRVPIEMFSHGVCIENPFGALGLAPGRILADLNRLANDALNAVYDQANMSNSWTLVVPKDLDFGSTRVPIGIGKVLRASNVNADNLKNQIVELKPSPANPQLMDIVRLAKEDGDSSVAAPGVLSGEPGKSGETFRGLATRHEAAKRQLSKSAIKYADFLSQILRNNAELNSIFLADDEVIGVLDHYMDSRKFTIDQSGAPTPEIRVGRDMYRRNYRVSFTADMRFAPQAQRISEADEIVAMGATPPLQADIAFHHRAYAKALRARGQHDMLPTLGPAPPPPQTPLGVPPPPPPPPPGMMGPPGGPPGGPPPGPFAGSGLPPQAQGPVQGPKPEGEQ